MQALNGQHTGAEEVVKRLVPGRGRVEARGAARAAVVGVGGAGAEALAEAVQVGGEPLGQGAESRRHVLAQPLLHRHEVVLAAGAVRQAEDVRLGGEGQMAAHLREEVARCRLGL